MWEKFLENFVLSFLSLTFQSFLIANRIYVSKTGKVDMYYPKLAWTSSSVLNLQSHGVAWQIRWNSS